MTHLLIHELSHVSLAEQIGLPLLEESVFIQVVVQPDGFIRYLEKFHDECGEYKDILSPPLGGSLVRKHGKPKGSPT